MGRTNQVPSDGDERNAVCKMRLERLKFVDGDYDVKGAYWGSGDPIYFARSVTTFTDSRGEFYAEVFVRARSREEAKEKVRELMCGATFFN